MLATNWTSLFGIKNPCSWYEVALENLEELKYDTILSHEEKKRKSNVVLACPSIIGLQISYYTKKKKIKKNNIMIYLYR